MEVLEDGTTMDDLTLAIVEMRGSRWMFRELL
jgi:hypothetical protein